MTTFTKFVLYTDRDGRAKFREERVPLGAGTPQTILSAIFPSAGYQLRQSPVGFRSQFHCTPQPQWVFVLAGEMEIGLQDSSVPLGHHDCPPLKYLGGVIVGSGDARCNGLFTFISSQGRNLSLLACDAHRPRNWRNDISRFIRIAQ